MNRENVLGVALLTLLVATSGCVSFVGGETLTLDASPAIVNEVALNETGYAAVGDETIRRNRNYTMAGITRSVNYADHVNRYERSLDSGTIGEYEFSRFVVITSPSAGVGSLEANPAGRANYTGVVRGYSTDKGFGNVWNLSHISNRSVISMGEKRTVAKYSADATLDGASVVAVYVHVVRFKHEGDYVVAGATYPQASTTDNHAEIDKLIRGIFH